MSLYKKLSAGFLLAAVLLSGGCAITPDSDLISKADWEISGKLGIREAQAQAQSAVLLFNWQQQDDRYLIHLFNALGRLELTLSGNRHFARAERSDGHKAEAENAEALLQQLVGWSFPVSATRFWLQGQTAGYENNIKHHDDNTLAGFTTPAWQVTLDRYRAVDGKNLPHRIKLNRDDISVTLIVKNHAAFTP